MGGKVEEIKKEIVEISPYDLISKFFYELFVLILNVFYWIIKKKIIKISITKLSKTKEYLPIVELIIKRADAKWPNLKINIKNELIIIEGEDLDCDAANKFILDRIKLIRCDKLNFIEENLMDNSDQIIQILERVINERRLLFSKPLRKPDGYYLVNALKDISEFKQFNNFLNSSFTTETIKIDETTELDSKKLLKFISTKLLNNPELVFSQNSKEIIIFARKQIISDLTKEIEALKSQNRFNEITLDFTQNEVIYLNIS
jgi:hypothetical protein